ncbi:CCR4-NOT transcription complex subunit 2 isoform X7 [Ischnura elegans]|uniref:CCR4-NOT transcription complex subunit 2 isoform X7 n=1 Tax=Ischnura elegans TaxID=197161 RepID=UPI001ED8BBD0|nr:CCR4-NOT transcription complex subunit 2 isoform X7 [Ischnura elegans]
MPGLEHKQVKRPWSLGAGHGIKTSSLGRTSISKGQRHKRGQSSHHRQSQGKGGTRSSSESSGKAWQHHRQLWQGGSMANLNFQQPPRSLAGGGGGGTQGLSRGAFGGPSPSSSSSGHATPTPMGGDRGLFLGAGGSFSSPPSGNSASSGQPLSPNRGMQPGMGAARNSLFGQRSFPDRRGLQSMGLPPTTQRKSNTGLSNRGGPGGGVGSGGLGIGGGLSGPGGIMGNSGMGGAVGLSGIGVLGGGGDGPSLSQSMPGKQPYDEWWQHGISFLMTSVGMVKQPTSEASEFTMSSEDFPALPGTQQQPQQSQVLGPSQSQGPPSQQQNSGLGSDGNPHQQATTNGTVTSLGLSQSSSDKGEVITTSSSRAPGAEKAQAAKRGIQTSPDGKVTNIPASMVKDQFGMVGLLTFIRAAETDPNLVSLALGQDLTALGLNLNSPDNLYPTFGGPWAEAPCRPQDIDFHVPPEYLINAAIRDKLAPVKLNRYKEDLLFYMFYTNMGDVLQLAAASELYNRDWRFHVDEKVWITRAPGMQLLEKTQSYERGTYYFFDAINWRKVLKTRENHMFSTREGRSKWFLEKPPSPPEPEEFKAPLHPGTYPLSPGLEMSMCDVKSLASQRLAPGTYSVFPLPRLHPRPWLHEFKWPPLAS